MAKAAAEAGAAQEKLEASRAERLENAVREQQAHAHAVAVKADAERKAAKASLQADGLEEEAGELTQMVEELESGDGSEGLARGQKLEAKLRDTGHSGAADKVHEIVEAAEAAKDEMGPGVLHVTLKQGKDLASMDTFGESDPYCVVGVGDDKQRSKAIQDNENPVWNETFGFMVGAPKSDVSDCPGAVSCMLYRCALVGGA